MPIKFLLFWWGVVDFLEGGGWKCRFYFYGRGDFSDFRNSLTMFFQVSQGIALYPPPPQKKKLALSQLRAEGGEGVSQLKLPSGGCRAIRGYR